jgi:hypothetical protein
LVDTVTKGTAWKTEEQWFYIPDSYKKIMCFSKASGPTVQPSQPFIQQISGSFFGGKAAGK